MYSETRQKRDGVREIRKERDRARIGAGRVAKEYSEMRQERDRERPRANRSRPRHVKRWKERDRARIEAMFT